MQSVSHLTSTVRADIDRNTTLCLACSSSLPPLKTKSSGIFITPCCQQPICPGCIAANPRLERYNPCLACLGGVGAVRSGSSTPAQPQLHNLARVNLDGSRRDEDVFTLGSEGEDEDEELDDKNGEEPPLGSPAKSSDPEAPPLPKERHVGDPAEVNAPSEEHVVSASAPYKYYITRTDTLQGIALRYGLNGRELCRLNNLPPSTLSTTPHLLHTRRFLILPPTPNLPGPSNTLTPEEEREREAQRDREKAEKRLQMLTKEVDWRVAKAYVALADGSSGDADGGEEFDRKRKELGTPVKGSASASGPSNLEGRAIERYLDDSEWEEDQRRAGLKVGPPAFPYGHGWGQGGKDDSRTDRGEDGAKPRRWWQWKDQ